jgi:hypothetical protein
MKGNPREYNKIKWICRNMDMDRDMDMMRLKRRLTCRTLLRCLEHFGF